MDKQIGQLIEAVAILESTANTRLKYEQLIPLVRVSKILQEALAMTELRSSSEKYAELFMTNSKCNKENPKTSNVIVKEIINRVLEPRKVMTISPVALTLSVLIAHPPSLGLNKWYIVRLLSNTSIDVTMLEGTTLKYFESIKHIEKKKCIICQRFLEHGKVTKNDQLVCLKCIVILKEFIENRSQSFEVPINCLNFNHLVKYNDNINDSFRVNEWQVEVTEGRVKIKPDEVLRVPLPFSEYQKPISY